MMMVCYLDAESDHKVSQVMLEYHSQLAGYTCYDNVLLILRSGCGLFLHSDVFLSYPVCGLPLQGSHHLFQK